jgi:type IV fimbrial biogenesis protein FimT
MDTRHQAGFTLWELLVAMLVAGILIGIGVPSFRESQRSGAMTAAANELITALLAARTEAVTRRVPVTLCASVDPTAANPVCSQNGAGANGGFIVWVDENGNLDVNGTPVLTDASDGNAVVDGGEATVLRRSAAPPSAVPNGTLRVFSASAGVNSGYVSFGANGFVRTAPGVGFGSAQSVLFCDDRGNKARFGGNDISTARVVRIDPTGRGYVLAAVADVTTAVAAIPGAVCPP